MNTDLDWRQRALCGIEPDLFFPEELKPAAVKAAAVTLARGVCMRCPVRTECRADVLASESGTPREHRSGVRAAMTPTERAEQDPIVQARKRVPA